MPLNRYSMGKVISCHHGRFILPSDVIEVEIDDNYIKFYCEDGIYEANLDEKWKLQKIKDSIV